MKKHLNYGLSQIKDRVIYVAVALVCVFCACAETNSPPPVAAVDRKQPSIASSAAQSAMVFDLSTLMNRIPTNEFTLSDKEGWDKFTMPKVQKWVRENLNGKKGRINVCMPQCNVTQEDANSKPDEWTGSLQVAGRHANANRILPIDKEDSSIPYLRKENPDAPPPSIGIKDKSSFTFKCTEAEARKWDACSKTSFSTVTVEGDIVEVYFLPHVDASLGDFIGYDIFVQLKNIAVTPSKDTEAGAIYACELDMSINGEDGYADVPDEGITEIKRLDNSGDYQLVFLKYNEWRTGKRNMTKLLSFSLNGTKITFTPCDNPPTETQISAAKAAVTWPAR